MNNNLFGVNYNPQGKGQPKKANAVNEAGMASYLPENEEVLAKLALTGVFDGTFYVSGNQMLQNILEYSAKVSPEFLAKTIVYARKAGFMKDTPAVMLNYLSLVDKQLFNPAFDVAIDNMRMLRGFTKIRMSGSVNKNKMASGQIKRVFRKFFDQMSAEQIFKNSVGNDPSLKQIIHWAHVKPNSPDKEELFKYLFDKEFDFNKLPKNAQDYILFCKDQTNPVPNVEFRQLTHLKLTKENWQKIVHNMGHHALRINTNALSKAGVFEDKETRKYVAERISDETEIKKSKVFPYQLMTALFNLDPDVPGEIKQALQDALEFSLINVPELLGKTVVLVDVSGSMGGSITGGYSYTGNYMKFVDVAALVASAILKKNPTAKIVCFDTSIHLPQFKSTNSILQNADIIRKFGGGGTNCELAMEWVVNNMKDVDSVVFLSDNEANAQVSGGNSPTFSYYGYGKITDNDGLSKAYKQFLKLTNKPSLVSVDMASTLTLQAPQDKKRILHVCGFSDQVFELMADFCNNEQKSLSDKIKEVKLG